MDASSDAMKQNQGVLLQMFAYSDSMPEFIVELNDALEYFEAQLKYNFNQNFNGRAVVGDDPYDINDVGYGNGNPDVRAEDESHGTHVAGIIAANRRNKKGIKGVANNAAIMALRAVPDGDEYDKDIALAIRYAADNGAKVINCSFGKSFSPTAEWVYEAIKYAAKKDVLIVHAAGNSGLNLDLDENTNYPNDHRYTDEEITNNMIEVGALTENYGSGMIADFSNYGKNRVDIFAPGDEIYSAMPNNEYEFQGGTSMAAPAVAGVAALIRGMHPSLTANQVKKIIMLSGYASKAEVLLAGDPSNSRMFTDASKSGKMVNAYNALNLARSVANGELDLDKINSL